MSHIKDPKETINTPINKPSEKLVPTPIMAVCFLHRQASLAFSFEKVKTRYYYSACNPFAFQNILIWRDYSNQLSEAHPEPVIVMIVMIMIVMVVILQMSERWRKSQEEGYLLAAVQRHHGIPWVTTLTFPHSKCFKNPVTHLYWHLFGSLSY